MLIEHIGVTALLEQSAEEAVEFAHASLKLARMLRNENKVHGKSREQLIDNLHEEAADLLLCLDELEHGDILKHKSIESWSNYKRNRMQNRLKEEFDYED